MSDKNCVSCNEEAYEEYLTEIYGTVKYGCLEFDAGRIIHKLNPTAFRVGMVAEECTCTDEEEV